MKNIERTGEVTLKTSSGDEVNDGKVLCPQASAPLRSDTFCTGRLASRNRDLFLRCLPCSLHVQPQCC